MYDYKTSRNKSTHYLFFVSNMIRNNSMDGTLYYHDCYESPQSDMKFPFNKYNPAFKFVHYECTDRSMDRPENYYKSFSAEEFLITVYDNGNDDLEIMLTYYDKKERRHITETFDELAMDSNILGHLNDKQIKMVRKKLTNFYNEYMDTPKQDLKWRIEQLQEKYLTGNYYK